MLSAESAVRLVQATERHNEAALVAGPDPPRHWLNPSKSLVDHALERWSNTRMRADNTSVVTLMLDPPGPPRAAVLRARTSQRPPRAVSPAPNPPVAPVPAPAPAPGLDPPQNGLTIMTRYSDTDRAPASAQPHASPLPPCATLDGRYSLGGRDDALTDVAVGAPGTTTSTNAAVDADRGYAFINYGNPAESSFMTRLLHRTRLVNTLGHVYEEIVNTTESLAHTDVDVPSGPGLVAEQAPSSPARADTGSAADERDASIDAGVLDDSRIQINEVSSSSPTDGPPRPRARRHHPAPSARVLRSQDVELHTLRPHTRRAAARAKPPDPVPHSQPTQPILERVVILNRARGVPVSPTVLRVSAPVETRTASRRTQSELPQAPVPASESGRVTRSKESVSIPLTQKITRSISNVARELRGQSQSTTLSSGQIPVTSRPGNSVRAPGPPRRPAPGPRTQNAHLTQQHPRTECSKENFGAARRRRAGARARGLLGLAAAHSVPPSSEHDGAPRSTRPGRRVPVDDDGIVEVHSTTDDHTTTSSCGGDSKVATTSRPRALRSRNDAEPPVPSTATRRELSKRPPPPAPAPIPAAKAAKLGTPIISAERCTRALAKRASGPWAPALALRNRLRKRLAK
ncbi:hypothetical protein EVAR_77681_1 [Eumeta japonica]|uniref:Uncharacterized protein n=1 Tax=Eumeta variegata TaxID=151549 RepID=A0A4C2A7V9_EUMVA|nr:hypothetical protein EVAR_77681_1 [Eumeta japonica]